MIKRSVVVGTVLWVTLANPGLSQQPQKVRFQCDAPKGHTCYFVVRPMSGSQKDFTMYGGTGDNVSGLVLGQDRYRVCVGIVPPEWNVCPQGCQYQGNFCSEIRTVKAVND